jgi:hypothetical protein
MFFHLNAFIVMIKQIITTLSLGLLLCTYSQAQTVQDIFSNYTIPVTWLGIDYSHSKIIGSVGSFGGKSTISAQELRDNYYPAWNHLILDEPEKFNLQSMIHRASVTKDLTVIKQLNAATSLDSMEAPITPYYTPTEIQHFISMYPIEVKSGIGLVFIAESMNKINNEAVYHVVFFNIETKDILLQERLKGTAGGIGLRNYWASSYGKVMGYIREDRYYKWQKQYKTNTKSMAAPKW